MTDLTRTEDAATRRAALDAHWRQFPEQCRDAITINRNRRLLAMVQDQSIDAVFELAGASGLFAEMMLAEHPETRCYRHTDISEVASGLAASRVCDCRFRSFPLDVETELDALHWMRGEWIVCTGMEHFEPGTDRLISERMPQGAYCLWSLSDFSRPDHRHVYPSLRMVVERFIHDIDILRVEKHRLTPANPSCVFLLWGIRR
jgi:hypothetical protein